MKTKSLIAALFLAASSAFAQVPSYVPTNGLVGWWPFNGNANDESVNGNNGIVNGPILYPDRSGITNSSYLFDRNSLQYITVSNSNNLNNITNTTISLWFNISSYGEVGASGHNHFINKSDQNNQHQFIVANNFTGLYLYYGSGNNFLQTNTLPQLNQWNNLVITYNYDGNPQNSKCKFYLNGALTDFFQTTASLPVTNYDLRFGSLGNASYDRVDGNMDDIGIWNRALSQQEITNLYNAQTCNSSSNTITADGPTTFCAGNFVNLKSDVVGGAYQWRRNSVNISTNATSRTFKATSTGSYTCVATCNGTALTSNAIAVSAKTNAAATVSASGATSFCAGDSVTLNATNLGSGYSVQWYRTNISMENATNYSQVVKQPGTYKVVTKNLTTGCSRISGSSAVVAVSCRLANPDVVVVDNELNDEAARTIREDMPEVIRIYPNPNEGSFTFEFQTDEEGAGDLQIINVMGQSIYNASVTSTDGFVQHQINLGNQFETGLYIVRYKLNGEQYDRKVILK